MNRKQKHKLKKDKNLVKDLYSIIFKYFPKLLDMIENLTDARNKNYIKLSPEIYNAINELLDFNYKNIYHKANDLDRLNEYKNMFY